MIHKVKPVRNVIVGAHHALPLIIAVSASPGTWLSKARMAPLNAWQLVHWGLSRIGKIRDALHAIHIVLLSAGKKPARRDNTRGATETQEAWNVFLSAQKVPGRLMGNAKTALQLVWSAQGHNSAQNACHITGWIKGCALNWYAVKVISLQSMVSVKSVIVLVLHAVNRLQIVLLANQVSNLIKLHGHASSRQFRPQEAERVK